MYALERGLHMKWLGVLFALFGTLASFGIGCATQVNAIATVCQANLGIPEWLVGAVVAVLTALVIFGGIQTIANVCEKLVPFMAAFYILGCLGILAYNHDYLWAAVTTILRLAFTPGAAAGGLTGGGITALPGAFSPTNPAWARPPLWQPPPRPATPFGRHWFRPAAPSGTPSSSA